MMTKYWQHKMPFSIDYEPVQRTQLTEDSGRIFGEK